MTIRCPHCRAEFAAEDQTERIQICPSCQARFNVDIDLEQVNLPAGTELGDYRIVRKLAVGGMSQVYLARQLSLDREVALKVIPLPAGDPDHALSQFMREIRATAALQHPGIVTVLEAGGQDNMCYLAMHHVDGESLDQLIERTGDLIDETEALRIAHAVAGAMAYAWNRERLLHRDLKPANIMVDRQRNVHLLDLGIAHRPTDPYPNSQPDHPIGTVHFMSPEQGRAEPDLDCRADIYSLGITLYQITTGECPFDGETTHEVIDKLCHDPVPPPTNYTPKLSPAFCQLIDVMLAKDRGDRPADWEALIEDIELVREGHSPQAPHPAEAPVEAPVEDDDPPAEAPPGRFPPVVLAATIAGILLILLIVLVVALVMVTRSS